MSTEIRTCQTGELDRLIPLLDEEFIFGKGRTVSMRRRFPTVYCENNLHNILLCVDGGEIVSSLAMRPFEWRDGDDIFQGAMIGAVYTHPAQRRQGWARRLLADAEIRLRETAADFAVLWTVQQTFYARLGWEAAGCGVLGEFAPDGSTAKSCGSVIRLQVETNGPRVEKIRRDLLSTATLRNAGDYGQIPLPAERIELLWCEDQGRVAYALLGSGSKTGFLHEFVGDARCFPALWDEACRDCERIVINDQAGSPSCRWLTGHAKVGWQSKNLAMWLPLSKRVKMARMQHWHVPYFDRI